LTNYEKLVKNFKEAEKLVTENSVILPMRNLRWMLDLHFPHYLGWNKPVIILENFEATTRYYPLVWNLEELPTVTLGDSIITDMCLYNKFPASSTNNVKIDFVITWGTDDMNECQKNLWMVVNQNYELIFSGGDPLVSLYKLKSTASFP